MNKKFLLVAALCAAMSLGAMAQTNLAKGIEPQKISSLTGDNIPTSLSGLTDGILNADVHLEGKNGEENAIQDFQIDLGESKDLGQIRIVWEGAASKDATISISDDARTWTKVVEKTGLGQRTEDKFNLEKGTKGRYVKFEAKEAVEWAWGVKMREFEVYQAEAAALTKISSSVNFVKKEEATDLGLKITDQFDNDFTDEVTLTADNGTITEGKLTATKTGTCNITATAGEKTITTSVYVLDDTMAPTKPTAKAANVYSIYSSNYTSEKFAHWMTWTNTDLSFDEITLGEQKVKPLVGGKKVAIGQKANESDAGEQWMNYDNSESKFTNLSIDVYATEDFTGTLSVETTSGKGNKTSQATLKANQWNTIELAGVPEGTLKCVAIETNGTFAPMLISNIYLYKLDANQVVVSKTANTKGFYSVTGNINAENVADLKKAEGTAFDLTAATIADGIKKIEFANPNALILVAGNYNANDGLTTTSSLTETNNVIVTDGNYYYAANGLKFVDDDKYPLCTSISIDTGKGTTKGYQVSRELAADSWVTTTPRFNVTELPEGVEAFELDTENSKDNQIVFKKAETLTENTPYVLHATKAASYTFGTTAENIDFNLSAYVPAEVKAQNVTFHGNYVAKKGTKAEYGLQNATVGEDNNLTFKKIGENATIGAFRAYFTVNDQDASIVNYSMIFGGETTGIKNVPTATVNKKANGVYTLDGRKISEGTSLNNLPKGIYIVNGKKIIK